MKVKTPAEIMRELMDSQLANDHADGMLFQPEVVERKTLLEFTFDKSKKKHKNAVTLLVNRMKETWKNWLARTDRKGNDQDIADFLQALGYRKNEITKIDSGIGKLVSDNSPLDFDDGNLAVSKSNNPAPTGNKTTNVVNNYNFATPPKEQLKQFELSNWKPDVGAKFTKGKDEYEYLGNQWAIITDSGKKQSGKITNAEASWHYLTLNGKDPAKMTGVQTQKVHPKARQPKANVAPTKPVKKKKNKKEIIGGVGVEQIDGVWKWTGGEEAGEKVPDRLVKLLPESVEINLGISLLEDEMLNEILGLSKFERIAQKAAEYAFRHQNDKEDETRFEEVGGVNLQDIFNKANDEDGKSTNSHKIGSSSNTPGGGNKLDQQRDKAINAGYVRSDVDDVIKKAKDKAIKHGSLSQALKNKVFTNEEKAILDAMMY